MIAEMGLLTVGSPLSWEETKKYADHVRTHGIKQFINLYHRVSGRSGDQLKFGDEVEYTLIHFNHEDKKARVLLKGHEVIPKLNELEKSKPLCTRSHWQPEYATYMVEGTPSKPYGHLIDYINTIEASMTRRRLAVMSVLEENEVVISLTNFARLGCPEFTFPVYQPTPIDGASRSLFFPDEAIFPSHPRFRTLTRNIRERRTEKVAINMPVFYDRNTPRPFVNELNDAESESAMIPDHVYADAMGFGMSACCLQVTLQGCDIEEACILYDQLIPVCPVIAAMTAAYPFLRGHLLDTDHRWASIVAGVDDRTPEERGVQSLKTSSRVIPKSRFDTVDSYISKQGQPYNDTESLRDEASYQKLVSSGVDKGIAQHIAHLFIRDPISLFSERINQDDENETDHFENIQSTNWQSMRFKPPPPNSDIGWRVEFRPMDAPITDFAKAAFVSFIVLLTRVIVSFRLNFLIPMSKVEESYRRAQKRGAVVTEKFYIREGNLLFSDGGEICVWNEVTECVGKDCCTTELTAAEIISGCNDFPGLVPLIRQYLREMEIDVITTTTINQYLSFIEDRASGKMKTDATWMREFVLAHEDYKYDSIVTERINYDLLCTLAKISNGELAPPDLLPNEYQTKTEAQIPSTTTTHEENLNERRKNV